MRTSRPSQPFKRLQRLQPLALASLLALGASGLNAAPRSFAGPGSFWDVVSNWSGGILPGVGDDALLGGFNTEVRTSFTLNSFSGTGSLTVSAGTLSFAAASSIGSLNLTGGTLAGVGTLQVAGASTWTSGTMTGTGATTFASSLALSTTGLKDITSGRTVNFNGTTTWTTTATSQGRIRTGSSAALNNNGSWQDQNAFDNSITQDFGGPASTFTNAGTYTKSGAGNTNIGIAFNNTSSGAGTGVVTVSAGALQLTGGGTSNGSFTGAAGTGLGFGGSHTLQAASSINTAGSVDFSSGTNSVAGSVTAGTATSFSGGTTTFTGTVSGVGSTITASGGTGVFNNAQAFNVAGLVISGGGLSFNNTGGVTTSSLNLTGGTLAGTSLVTVTGATTWTAGTMTGTGTTTLNSNLALNTVGLKDITNGRVVNFNGTTTWSTPGASQGRIRTGSSAALNNNGTWLDQNAFDNSISQDFGGPPSSFTNAGTYTKSGAGTTTIGIAFNNTSSGAGTGVVNVNAGRLQLNGGGTSNGSFAGAAGTTLGLGGGITLEAASSISTLGAVEFASGTVSLGGSYSVAGTTTVNGGTANFTGTVANSGGALVLSSGTANFSNSAGVQFASLDLSGSGTLGGTQAVTFTGPATWTGGTLNGVGTTTFAAGATLSGGGFKDVTNRTVVFTGTTTWSKPANDDAGRIRTGSNATLRNTGTWADQNAFSNRISQDFGGPASTFVNRGTYNKTGAGTTTIAIGFNNENVGAGTGIVNLNAGSLLLTGGGASNGSFVGAAGTTLGLGGGMTLDAASSVSTLGAVEFASGTVSMGGSYSVAGTTTVNGGTANFTGTVANSGGALVLSSGTANFSNSAGVQFASLDLSGSGTIGGTQAVTFTGPATWTGGTLNGTGTTTFAAGATLSGGGFKDVTNRTVVFTGTTTWSKPANDDAGRIRTGSNATLRNTGTWQDQNAFNNRISQDFGGPTSTFVNAGTYSKTGAGTTTIAIAFNNEAAGTLNVNNGRLQLDGSGTSAGAINMAAGTTLAFGGGTHDLGGTLTANAAAQLRVEGATVNNTSAKNLAGTLDLASGTFNANSNFTTNDYVQTGATLGGSGAVVVNGSATWAGGQMTGTGSTTINGPLALAGNTNRSVVTRTVNFNGTTTWSNLSAGSGLIQTGSGATLANAGTWLDQNAFSNRIGNDFGGPASTFVNTGTYRKTGSATTDINIGFNNTGGTLQVEAGSLNLAGLSNFAGTTLTGGTYNVVGPSTLQFAGANVVTNAATLLLDGSGANFLNSSTAGSALANFATNAAAGSFTIRNGRNFTTLGAFSNAGLVNVGTGSTFTTTGSFTDQPSGTLQMAGGTFAAANLANAGTVAGFGAVNPVVNNTGLVRATGGTLVSRGVQGNTGNVTIDAAATLDLSTAAAGSTAFVLTDAGNLALGAQSLTVFKDYSNANFGSGNSFAARAGVTGAGQIIGSNASQTLAGQVVAGAANTFTVDFGKVRGGTAATRSFQIANNGTGADIRGALQTGGPGLGNLTDARLSGTGSVAANFGPILAGTNGGDLGLTLIAGSLGGALSGQSFAVVSNFGNVATQTVSLSGFTTVLAQGAATPAGPLNLGNFRVGVPPAVSTNLAVSNTTTGAGAEQLGISSASATGNFSASNNLGSGLVAAGATSANAVTVASAGGTVGVNSGNVTLQFVTNGQIFDNSFINLAANQQTLAVQATGFLQAQPALPASVAVGNHRLTTGASSAFTLTNTNLAPVGFQEVLNATPGSTTAGVTLLGSVAGLAPGASSNNFVIGFAAGGAAGARSGSANVTLVSDGTGTSGLGLLGLNNGVVGITGTAFNVAVGAATPTPVVVGNQRLNGIGGSASVALNVANNAAAGSFSEALNASFGAVSGQVTTNGGSFTNVAAGSSNNTALVVSVNNTQAGNRTGSVTLAYQTDGTGSNGNSGLAAVGAGTQTVNVSGSVFRLATASAASPAALVFNNVRQGSGTLQNITLANTALADGFSEGLNASINASSGFFASGSFSLLAAGANSSALGVSMDTSTAGARSGTATITLASDGSAAGNSGFGALGIGTQVVNLSGGVFRLASASAATPNPVALANQRVGGTLSQLITLSNTAAADGFSERLNASITASGTATAAGSFSLLAAGASSNALSVGVDTSSAGAKSGIATITLASDGTGTSGFGAFGLNAQTVNVSGNVFRLAQPVVDTTPLVMIARVGDAALSRNIGVSNNAPDLFTERLNASIASNPAGTSAGPALLGLAPNASGNLLLSLPTTTAGSFNGPVGVALVSSSAGTTSGAPDFNLGSVNVGLTGRVYAPAVAQLPVTVVNFGTVRVGDSVAARPVTVSNAAAGALTDTLSATLSGGGAPFSASGSVAGLAAGSSNASALQVQLNTANAGVFNGNASVALLSQNPDLADLTLAAVGITLQGQVNNLASVSLAQAGGGGTFSGAATSYTLDFGTVVTDASGLTGSLNLTNAATGTADALAGSWNLAALAGGPFSVAGFQAFTGLAAGSQLAGLNISFDISSEGSFSSTVVLNGLSTNGSGPDLALNPITLQLQGTVVAVPEPGTYLMMAVGVLAMGSIARRKLRARQD